MVDILCLVDGESTSSAFPVNVGALDTTIGGFKNLIKEQYPDKFKGVDTTTFTLWRVNIPVQGQITLNLPNNPSILSPMNLNEVQKSAIANCLLDELIPLSRLNLNEGQKAAITKCWLEVKVVVDVKLLDSPRASLSSVFPAGPTECDYVIVQPPSGNATH